MKSKPKSLSGTPTVADSASKSLSFETAQNLPDMWSGWQISSIHSEQALVKTSDFTSSPSSPTTARLRKALKNPGFLKAFNRVKAQMELASQSPLRRIVIHYRAEEPLYPSDEVMLHFSAHEHLQRFFVLCSRQGRVRPEHPDWPLGPDGFSARVWRDPYSKV